MEVLIIPVKESAAEDFQKIYNGLRATGNKEYAYYAWKKVVIANVTKESPYVEIKIEE